MFIHIKFCLSQQILDSQTSFLSLSVMSKVGDNHIIFYSGNIVLDVCVGL